MCSSTKPPCTIPPRHSLSPTYRLIAGFNTLCGWRNHRAPLRRLIEAFVSFLQSVGGVSPAHLSPHPTRPREEHNLLSHLPLHSQQAGRPPSLLIPIGGIHMIQPRSLLPLYSLVSSPAVDPAGTSWRRSDAQKGRASLLRQSSLKEASLGTLVPDGPRGKVESSQSGGPPRDNQGRCCVQQPSSPRAGSTH